MHYHYQQAFNLLTLEDANRIFNLKEGNSGLRSQLCSLKDQYELVIQERESLKLALQLVSKDLYFQSKKNEDKDKPKASPSSDSDPYANSSQTTSRKKCNKNSTSKNPTPKSDGRGSSTAGERTTKPITVIAGDSIIQRLPGWKMAKKHKVVVKSFSSATVQDMEDYVKPIKKNEPDDVFLNTLQMTPI